MLWSAHELDMNNLYDGDEVAEGLLRLAAKLQEFAASVLGLELDYGECLCYKFNRVYMTFW